MKKTGNCSLFNSDHLKSVKEKFLYALFPCGLLSFIYFFFGPIELVYSNQEYMKVGIIRATPFFLLSFLLVAFLLAIGISLCNGSLFDALTKLVLGLSVASYVQANFLNTGFDYLDGSTVPWQKFASEASLNLLVWAAIIAAVYILAKILKKHWANVCRGISVLLLLMQAAGLAALYADPTPAKAGSDGDEFYLSVAEQYNISANENVIVFILDACSNRTVEDMTAQYPDALDSFSDFTYYQNCAPSYYGTFPEVMVMLTGNDQYDTTRSWRDFVASSWSSEKCNTFYDTLASKGYERNVFDSEIYISNTYPLIEGKIDNALPNDGSSKRFKINAAELYSNVEKLTLYRYFPIAMKACYWTSDFDYGDILEGYSDDRWSCVESEWYSGLKRFDFNVKENNVFSVYHFWGAHPPFRNDELGKPVEIHSDRNKQLCGSFYILSDYIQMLKDLDVYDSSTIVVMGDHGDYTITGSTSSSSAVFMIKRKNETHQEMVVSSAPITHLEFLPTIIAEVDPTLPVGETVFSIEEDAIRDRTLYYWAKTDDLAPGKFDSLYKFTVPANINDLNELVTPEEIVPIMDSFY